MNPRLYAVFPLYHSRYHLTNLVPVRIINGYYVTRYFLMFFFLGTRMTVFNYLLVVAAVLPAAFLMIRVYHSDRLERESSRMIRSLIIAGIVSTLLAQIEERVGQTILNLFVPQNTRLYNMILYYGIVAIAEESSKYLFMKRRTWNNPEFNCQYDGVVYAVIVSLGFALWENINYVLAYGMSTAIIRALTAVPGHACFGVFMGVFYGIARKHENWGNKDTSRFMRFLSLFVPMTLHGAYDYIATLQTTFSSLYFLGFIAVMFIISLILVSRTSKKDQYIRYW